jgi:hypothetical protein
MGKKHLLIFSSILLFSVSVISLSTVDASSIPDWVKNNAKWWAEGSISETDYISSLQYLINQGILSIPIPITEVIAASTSLSDDERAQSIVVRFSDGPMPTERPFTTFSSFQSVSPRDDILHRSVYVFGDKPQFILESLPSIDKVDLYRAIDKVYFAKTSPTITRFDVAIDILAGDGSLIQTWQYNKCQVFGYGTFLTDLTNFIPFSGQEGSEFRDKIVFECAGIRLQVP